MTEQDLINGGLERQDNQDLVVQAWIDNPNGIYYIYIPQNGKLYLMPEGYNNYDDAILEIHQWSVMRQIINKLSITNEEKDALIDQIPRRSLVSDEITQL